MVYLVLAIVSSAMVSVCMRLSTNRIKGNVAMLVMNYFMCLLLACCFTGPKNLMPAGPSFPRTVGLGLINGAFYLVSFVCMQRNIVKNGVVLSATFMKLGLLVPIIISVVCFREVPDAVQVIGFVVAVLAILLINLKQDDAAVQSPVGLILLLLTGGMADAMSKIYEEVGDRALSEQFLVYTFFSAMILCLFLMAQKKQRIGLPELGFGMLIGIPNFFSSRFLLLALKHIPAVVTYPTYSVSAILLITLIGVLVFRERLSRRQWLGLGMIILALMLLNL